jgi:predicted dehydrogenase
VDKCVVNTVTDAPGPLRVAVVGGGRVAAAVHLPLIRLSPDTFTLAAVVETDPERAAVLANEYPEALVTASLEKAFAAGVEALICATPWPGHRDVVLAALRRGIPVLTEKPVSLDPDEIEELIAAESASGAAVSVGYMKRHDPAAELFVEAVAGHLDSLIRIGVEIVDPDAAHQVAHRLAVATAPSPRTRQISRDAIERLLGPSASPGRREVYGRGLGGSLVHQINLVQAALGGGPSLLGRLGYCVHWAEASSVSCGWWPSDAFAVQMTHVRAPEVEVYRERIEAVTRERRFVLDGVSPYLLEQPMTFTEYGPGGRVGTFSSPPLDHGFVRQLRRWAESVRNPAAPRLPSLAEARRDLAVVREAALAATAAGTGKAGL